MNKRKNRGGPVRSQRQRSIASEGVYSNPPYVHAATSQIGNIARIKTASGQVWEGVFKTFSQHFDVVLEVATKVENPDGPDSRLLTETHRDRLIFRPCDILSMTFTNVDMDYPVKDTFQTDTAISARLNGNKSEERELEPWDAGQVNGNDNLILDLETSNGWDVEDMFRKNEQDYGVQSTFDHSLRGYTLPLQTSDSADYKEAQAKAEQIASEIESQPAYKARLELENGDEEAAFAAVVRPNQQDSSNGKYIPPAKRKGQNNGKLVRSTPPPSSGSSSQNSPSPKDTRPPIQYPPHANQHPSHQGNMHQVTSPHTPPQQQPPQSIQHVAPPPHIHNAIPPQVVPPQMQNMPPQVHQQPMPPMPQHVPLPNNPPPPRPNSHTPPHQYQQGPPPRQVASHVVAHTGAPPHGKPQMNGDIKSGPQQRQQRHQQQYQQQQMQERITQVVPPGHPQGPPPQQVAYQEIKQDSPQPHQMLPQQIPPQSLPQARPPPPSHQQPRHDGGPPPPQAQEALKELHVFSQEFQLAPLPPHVSPTLPSVPQQQHVPQGMQPPPLTPHMSGAESPQLVPHMGPPIQGHSAGTSPNSSTSNLSTLNSGGDQSQSSIGSQKQPSPAQSPQSSESEKLQNTVAKSKLNPNAKEFVLNPTAKPFQPRSPSTPSASRPHTPQTPSHSPYITAVSGPGGPPMQTMVMPMYHMISQPQYQPPPTNRLRKIPMGQIRTEMASQMQHAAAVTGQPLLAPAPIPQLFYPGAAAAHGMNQAAAYPTMAAMHAATIRMYDAAAAAAAAATPTQIPYLPPQPSGTPSPAQAPYNPAAVQQPQGPPQGYQTVPPQQAPPQIPMFCIPTQPHMLPNVPYLQQAPPPGPPHHPVQVLVHPSQGGNPHGPNP